MMFPYSIISNIWYTELLVSVQFWNTRLVPCLMVHIPISAFFQLIQRQLIRFSTSHMISTIHLLSEVYIFQFILTSVHAQGLPEELSIWSCALGLGRGSVSIDFNLKF